LKSSDTKEVFRLPELPQAAKPHGLGVARAPVDWVAEAPGNIVVDNVSVRFSGGSKPGAVHTAVQSVSLTIRAGEFVCFVGPSGCGKSTLLNTIAGRIQPSEGAVIFDGRAVERINTAVGYMTQEDNLLPWRTLGRNVAIPLEIRGVGKREREERVAEVLEKVGLRKFADLYPEQLSGGMRKRAALARTLVYRPGTLLLDEPFGAVDAFLRASLQEQLQELWTRDRKTVVFVTHDLEEALLLADTVHVFGINPGRLIHSESIDLDRPRNLINLRVEPRFAAMWRRLWDVLHVELASVEQPE